MPLSFLPFIEALMLIHIGAGLFTLAAGPPAMLAKPKGGTRHRAWGRAYLRGMFVVAVSAALLLVFRWNPFFFALSVLSFYLAFSGERVLRRKCPHKSRSERATRRDIAAARVTVCVGIASFGLWRAGVFGTDAAVVMGTLSFAVATAGYDLWRFKHPERFATRPTLWLVEHITKLGGSYIALLSAFSGTVFTALPVALAQTWPALFGVPLMLYVANGYWRRAGSRELTTETRRTRRTKRGQ